jgi:hypothetical protein
LAEEQGLTDDIPMPQGPCSKLYETKLAMARKMALIEKRIEGEAHGGDNKHLSTLSTGAQMSKLDDADLAKLKSCPLSKLLHALHNAHISLPVCDFLRLVSGEVSDNDVKSVADSLPGVYSKLVGSGGDEEAASDSAYDGEEGALPSVVREMIEKMVGSHSLAEQPTQMRIRVMVIRGVKPHLREHAKEASQSPRIEHLAREFVKYQLSTAACNTESDVGNELMVLQNYVA